MQTKNLEDNHFSVQLKPVGSFCNIQCDYCYVKSHLASYHIMSEEILRVLIQKVVSQDYLSPTFSWHGGEPLVAGLNFFNHAIELMNIVKKPEQTVYNLIQTNGILITPEFASFFYDNQFGVSVSLDGPYNVHGIYRKYSNGKNTFDAVIRGIDNLVNAGINPGIMCTVTKESLTYVEETFDFFVDQGYTKIKFNPVFDSTKDEFSLSNEEWLQYLKTVFDKWFQKGDPNYQIRELDEVISWISNNSINVCSSKNNCLNWISINPNGDVYPCEYLKEEFYYGNILTLDLKSIHQLTNYKRFFNIFNTVPEKCQECKFYNMCGNGCPSTRVENGNISFSGVYNFCNQRRNLYYEIKRKFDDVLSS